MSLRWFLLTLALVGCRPSGSRNEDRTPPLATPPPAASSSTVSNATALETRASRSGSITGHVRFHGKVEPRVKVDASGDPFCLKAGALDPSVTRVGKDDGLLDAVVHLANGEANGDPALAPKAVVHQKGCAYFPYAIGVLAGASIEFANDDRTMHNIHGSLETRDVVNFALASGEPPRVVKAPTEPGIVKLRCDVHKWMRGFLVVSDHPWFASTSEEGAFTLAKVPVGKHVLEAFHPTHGTKRATVEVKEGESVVDFTFTDEDKAP